MMQKTKLYVLQLSILLTIAAQAGMAQMLATPNPSTEAKELYAYLTSISGKQTLAGQHNAPLEQSTQLSVVHRKTNQYPAVFGQDFGFSYPGYWDGINYRQRIVDEAITRHSQGFIITLMWHAVPPTLNEPMEFKEGIQCEVSNKEWKEIITPGTLLNEKWKSQVDVIAWFLKQLQYAKVPVIWRPYHEMNGAWFWWGQKKGDDGYKKLYQMMFDRLVNFHGLNNLIWVYNCNEVKMGVDAYDTYYPGDAYVDVLATDVYSEYYNDANYKDMCTLADKTQKLMAIGEMGKYPTVDILKKQPRWAWMMAWEGPESFGNNIKNVIEVMNSDVVTSHNELPWVKVKEPRVHYPVLE